MDSSAGDGISKASGAESASASNTPSEEAPDAPRDGHSRSSGGSEGSQRAGPGPAELGGALGFFLKRTSQLEESSGASQFSAMFRDLKSDDSTRQIMALTELSEYLSFSSEEALISFPMETFIPVLISLLENPGHSDESAAQVMLLCCRCLFNVVDILPPTARIITAAGGLPVLCANLLNVEYIDVAELAVAIIEWISEDQPLQVLKADGLQAILTFLDFFQISVQRQAANAAALMLLPVPPADTLEQHVRPVLPTLAALLQHADPQVLQSVCECWRRVLDNTIAVHGRPRSGGCPASGPASSLGRMVAKGKWRPGDRKKDKGDDPAESAAAAGSNAAPKPIADILEEMCPNNVLSNLLSLLGGGISSPSPHSSVMVGEVLYILAVLTNYSDTFTEEVLKQDICALLRQMVLAMDFMHGGPTVSQTSSGLLRVLAAVASMLPALHIAESACECEEKRLALFRDNPVYLDALGEAFLPLLMDVYEASMDPNIQSLCVTLLLTFFLTCRERPELIRRSLDPTQLACFLANLLLVGASKSVTLACLLVVSELMERHLATYSLLFVRHGVARAIHRLIAREEEAQRRQSKAAAAGRQLEQRARARASPAAPSKARPRSRSQLVDEVAQRVASTYLASPSNSGESAILRALGKIAKQLRSSPHAVVPAHREALSKLHDLLLTSDGITAFELTCSGTASALNTFLYPGSGSGGSTAMITDAADAYSERLRLFLECIGQSPSGALAKLIRLCVAAVQRIEQQPLTLFPAHASLAAALPPHLRLQVLPVQPPNRGEGSAASRSGFGAMGEFPPGFGSRMGNRGYDSGPGTSTLLSVLRLLAKPVRVRMAPHGALGFSSLPGGGGAAVPNFRTLLMPFGGKAAPPRLLEPKAGSSVAAMAAAASAIASPASAAAKAAVGAMAGPPPTGPDLNPVAAASPAARLRNYLASKVGRKRAVPSAGAGASSSAPAEKRSGMSSFLSKADPKPSSRPAAASAEDAWAAGPGHPWEGAGGDDEGAGRSSEAAMGCASGAPPPHPGGPGSYTSGARGSSDGASPREQESGGSSSHMRDREREILGEALEAVLLVEPFALVSALEDYIWEKHGPKPAPSESSAATGATTGATSAGPSENAAAAAGAAALANAPRGPAENAAAAGAGMEPASAGAAAATPTSMEATDTGAAATPTSMEATDTGPAGDDAPPAPGANACASSTATPATASSAGGSAAPSPPQAATPPQEGARLRLSVKQPALNIPRDRPVQPNGSGEGEASTSSPRTPLAILDPGTPAAAAPEPPPPAASPPPAAAASSSGGGPHAASGESKKQVVQIYLNGQLLHSKTSVVQSLVNSAGRMPRGRVAAIAHEEASHMRFRADRLSDRFLASAEEGSGSDADGSQDANPLGAHTSPRHFCGAIWGRVHVMTYEIVDNPKTSPEAEGQSPPPASGEEHAKFVPTDFDSLVQCHARVVPAIAALQSPAALGLSASAAADPEETSANSELTPRSAGSKDDSDVAAKAPTCVAGDPQALTAMLQLISAFHNVCDYQRACQGPLGVPQGAPDEGAFHCNTLTSMLLRQLSDPLAVCTGSVPSWCTKLTSACRFLFPYSVRRILHHSCNLGLSRAFHHVQQRALAQHAHSQETQRRLEGEVAVASIPRQKVRISRQRILESAVKVMNLYGAGSAILEVEYVGEVGTGSGPTLEFYAQISEIIRTSEPQLFRKGVPTATLFPEPWDPEWLRKGECQAAQQILERFRLLGHVVAKCILDNRLVDLQLHPFFWRAVLGSAPFSQRALRDVDPELFNSLDGLRDMEDEALAQLCVDFTLPGHPQIELTPGGAGTSLSRDNAEEYVTRVAEVSLVTAVAPQVAAFRTAFKELLPLDACQVWSEKELSSIIMGSSVRDDALWTLEHLGAHIKAQHGYTADSRCFRDLLAAMTELPPDDRRKFLTFVTGAPTLPIGGFAGLKPPLTVVKKEAPPAPLTPDQFMPSVMTCANYLKLPEYSSADILRQKLELAMREGQSAFLLS